MKHPKKISKHIVSWINRYLENSKINGLVIGVSGGIDSALSSTLCAETGKKLICIEMPIKQEDAQISRAKKHGVSVVGLRNSGHLGRIGDWAERAADADLISFHFVNVRGSLLVAQFGGSDKRGSTSPLAIGIPSKDKDHIILDMATSTVAEGKVMVAQKGGKQLPHGALIDSTGKLTTNPEAMYGKIRDDEVPNPDKGTGAITAFGLHKGSGINFMMEMLGGALTGNGVCGALNEKERRKFSNGMLSIYIEVEKMVDFDYFRKEVESYAEFVRASKPSQNNDKVLIPGDKEISTKEERLKFGLPVPPLVWENIKQTANKLNVENLERFENAIK